MKRRVKSIVMAILCSTVLVVASARTAPAQVLSGLAGTVAGAAGGGYVTLSIVVARAQFGHYLHDYYDLFDWKSLPILVGAGTGATLGVLEPDRLWSAITFGTAGTAAGVGIGYLVGRSVSDLPEGKWAGAAIGGGVGLTIGTVFGIVRARNPIVPDQVRSAAVVPIGIRIPL